MVGATGAGALPELPRREPYRTLPGAAVVFAVIVALVGTLVVVDDNVSGAEAIPPGSTVDVGGGVTYVPADGWYLVRERTTPGETSTIAKQGATFAVKSADWAGTLAEQVDRTRRGLAADDSVELTGADVSFHSQGGLTGVRLAFVGPSTQGRTWVAVDRAAQRAVVVYAISAPQVEQQVADQVDAMVDSIRITGAGG